jgi:hypothetical protein
MIAGIHMAADAHARKFFVFARMIAAVLRDTNIVPPMMQPSSVVWRVVNPKDSIMSEYWLVSPFCISRPHA